MLPVRMEWCTPAVFCGATLHACRARERERESGAIFCQCSNKSWASCGVSTVVTAALALLLPAASSRRVDLVCPRFSLQCVLLDTLFVSIRDHAMRSYAYLLYPSFLPTRVVRSSLLVLFGRTCRTGDALYCSRFKVYGRLLHEVLRHKSEFKTVVAALDRHWGDVAAMTV